MLSPLSSFQKTSPNLIVVEAFYGLFVFSPSSTRRRMASERETSCFFDHEFNVVIVSRSKRVGIVSPYLMPGGRPSLFLCTVLSCLVMTIRVHEKQAEGKGKLPPRL